MTYHIWRCFILPRVDLINFLEVKPFFEIIFTPWQVVYLFVGGFRMLLDFFVWDVKKLRNIYRHRHAVSGQQLLVRLFLQVSGFSECMLLTLKTSRRFGRHISFVWFDLNLLQQVSVAVVQISDHKVSWSAFRLQYFKFVIVARKYFLYIMHGHKISVDLTSSAIVVASVQLCIMLKTGELL